MARFSSICSGAASITQAQPAGDIIQRGMQGEMGLQRRVGAQLAEGEAHALAPREPGLAGRFLRGDAPAAGQEDGRDVAAHQAHADHDPPVRSCLTLRVENPYHLDLLGAGRGPQPDQVAHALAQQRARHGRNPGNAAELGHRLLHADDGDGDFRDHPRAHR